MFGVVFGYVVIKLVFKLEGVYKDICLVLGGLVSEDICIEIYLNLMFMVVVVVMNVVVFFIGVIFDYYGFWVCGVFGSFFLVIGVVLMVNESCLFFDGLLFGYFFLVLGGFFIYILLF